jgi:hypothetical protein
LVPRRLASAAKERRRVGSRGRLHYAIPPLKPKPQGKASLYLRVLALVLAPVDLVPVVALGDAPVAAVVEGGVVGVGLDGGAVRRRSGRPVLGGEGIREGEAEGSPNTT